MLARSPFALLLLWLCAVRAAALTVTAPNGGEILGRNVDHSILWSSSVGGSVRIELLRDGVLFSTLTSSTTNDGNYTWRFGSTQQPGGNFRIRITSTSNATETDTSDADVCLTTGSFDTALALEADAQASPPQITVKWPGWPASTTNSYTVYRRAPGGTTWGTAVATLPKTATNYVDTTVSVGTVYEYRVSRAPTSGATAHGYIYSGIDVPLVENRGKIILVVDNTMAAPLAVELARLTRDLAGDGWEVIRRDVARNASPATVKDIIKADYNADSANVKAAFLFGHVPVPYSGNTAPDGHPDHQGAWPADNYYADLDGVWTDTVVNNTTASGTRNDNIPGDGKFDHSAMPTDAEIAVGRVDLASMSAFALSETELLRQYLTKAHRYRFKLLTAANRSLVDDEFNLYAESGWRTGAALSGPSEVWARDWNATLQANDYMFAYGGGPGSYTSAGSVTSTTDIADRDPRAIFTTLFGSYFGDWDNANNLLRAPLATSMGLTCAWAGRPGWVFHPMSLGETIGAACRLTQNNPSTTNYSIGGYTRGVQIALMGDPALRWHVVPPPSSVTLSGQTLSWTASPDPAVLGYHVYRSAAEFGPFTRVNATLVNDTSFSDATGGSGFVYMVRAIKREITRTGTYFNASQGIFFSPASVATAVHVFPANKAVPTGSTQQFTANLVDQFGYPLAQQPAFSWASSGAGTMSNAGLFTAGTMTGFATVSATAAALTGNAAVTVSAAAGTGTGYTSERWDGPTGSTVADLRAWAAFPHFPSAVSTATGLFESGANSADNYGRRMRGIFTAPVTGAYRFLIASDDSGELRLSTDTNPNNATVVATVNGSTSSRQWTKYPSQTSASISLAAGQQCYLEALQKEATGGDHLAVGIDLPGGVPERPLLANRFNPFTGWVPAPWAHSDIGTTSSTLNPQAFAEFLPATGAFNLRNAGGSDIGGTADGFRFVRQTISGDVIITARVAGVANTNADAKAGVMLRQNTNANSANAAMVITAANGATFQTRATSGGTTTAANVTGIAPPYWVRLERVGTRVRGYASTDGTSSWQRVGADVTLSLSNPVLVGLAATSRSTSTLGLAKIGDVSVVSLTPVQSWRARNDLPFDGSGSGADLADPDGDGIPNLLECALGLSPQTANASALPPAVVVSSRLALTFQRDPALTDLTYTVEAAPAVTGPWTPIARSTGGAATMNLGSAFAVSETGTTPRSVIVVDGPAIASDPDRFLRLRVTR